MPSTRPVTITVASAVQVPLPITAGVVEGRNVGWGVVRIDVWIELAFVTVADLLDGLIEAGLTDGVLLADLVGVVDTLLVEDERAAGLHAQPL